MASEEFVPHTFQELIDADILEIGDGYRAKNEELGGTGPIFLRAGHVTDTHIDFAGVERFHAELESKLQGSTDDLDANARDLRTLMKETTP